MGTRVVVLGGSGMLGSMTTQVLTAETDFDVIATFRSTRPPEFPLTRPVEWRRMDAMEATDYEIGKVLDGVEVVINAIGITKPFIDDRDGWSRYQALAVNSLFPYLVGRAAASRGIRVIQIATDCVYAGKSGGYTEDDPHDPLDVYGKTKSLGEAPLTSITHLRCSIIGPEQREGAFLLDWVLSQTPGAVLPGYSNHLWNGLTTLHFARVVAGVIRMGLTGPTMHHLVPADSVTKAELLRIIADAYRLDIYVEPSQAPQEIDRTLATQNPSFNAELWKAAGYTAPPSIHEMLQELATHPNSPERVAGTMGVE